MAAEFIASMSEIHFCCGDQSRSGIWQLWQALATICHEAECLIELDG